MAKREPVTMYFSEEEKEAIEKEAAAEGKSVSGYCRDLFEECRRKQIQEDVADELDAEERLERILREGTDQMEEIAEDVREQQELMIHILREIESELKDVDPEALYDD